MAVAACRPSVFTSLSSAAVYCIGIVLPSAMTPIVFSPTLSGAQMSALMAVWLIVRRGSLSTSLTTSPIPFAATAPVMPSPRRKPRMPGNSSPNPAMVFRSPVSSSSSSTIPSVATMR